MTDPPDIRLSSSEYSRLNLWVMQAATWQNRIRLGPFSFGSFADPVAHYRVTGSMWPRLHDFWRRFSVFPS